MIGMTHTKTIAKFSLHSILSIFEIEIIDRLNIYTMQKKFSNCFCMCQIHHIRLLLSDYCIKIYYEISVNIYTYIQMYIHTYETRIRRRLGLLLPSHISITMKVQEYDI